MNMDGICNSHILTSSICNFICMPHTLLPHTCTVLYPPQVRVGLGVVRRNIMSVALAVIGYAAGKRYKSICNIKREKSTLNRF